MDGTGLRNRSTKKLPPVTGGSVVYLISSSAIWMALVAAPLRT